MFAAEKETPYSLRTQIFLSVQSASLVLDGPDSEQASHDNMGFHLMMAFLNPDSCLLILPA